MIGWLAKFTPGGTLGLYAIFGLISVVSIGGVYWKVNSYIKNHNELVEAYDRQRMELNQALQVNLHNIDKIEQIQIEAQHTVVQLESQRNLEIQNRQTVETQLERIQRLMRETESEVVYVESTESCPPQYGVHPVLANPFGRLLIESASRD